MPAAIASRMRRLIPLLLVTACTSNPLPDESDPASSDGKADGAGSGSKQRVGDPVKGRDYLINGNYFPCGIPDTAYKAIDALGLIPSDGSTTPNELGRTGRNAELPYRFTSYRAPSGVDMVTVNCLYCHGGRIDGALTVGLGNNAQDFTYPGSFAGGLSEVAGALGSLVLSQAESAELARFLERFGAVGSRIQMRTKGMNPGNVIPRILGAYRDPTTLAWRGTIDTSIMPVGEPAAVDVPPWWRVAKKQKLYYTGEGEGDHARLLMSAAMYCADDVATATEFDKRFVDVVAYIKSIKAPKWPGTLDQAKVSAGQTLYGARCASCHGTPSVYQNRAIPIADVGTDPTLAQQEASPRSIAFNTWYEKSWYGVTGLSRIVPKLTYVAPPLDGVWATAPYLHNGSVPNLDTLLDSTKRPLYWTRDFSSSAIDRDKVGVIYTELDHGHAGAWSWERDEIYDTTLAGHSADGHTYADDLSAADRAALIEYLKSL